VGPSARNPFYFEIIDSQEVTKTAQRCPKSIIPQLPPKVTYYIKPKQEVDAGTID
jgi:hypothetical protein